MDRSNFIHAYLAAFLGAVAAERYLRNGDPTWKWVKSQPIEDATYLAEAAWDSLKTSVPQSSPVITGTVEAATAVTVSTPTTSNTPDTVDPTL
jgi:hypothetical protein